MELEHKFQVKNVLQSIKTEGTKHLSYCVTIFEGELSIIVHLKPSKEDIRIKILPLLQKQQGGQKPTLRVWIENTSDSYYRCRWAT